MVDPRVGGAGGGAAAAAAAGGVAVVPVTFTFEPFNAATSKFDRWLERLQVSFRIYHVPDADKRDYLLHYMGGATYDVLCNKLKNEKPETKTFDELFASRKQLEHESLSEYLMDLEKLAQTCNFEDHLDKAIRNQFVFGIRNRVIQSRLLEIRNLTLAKAKEIGFGMEMSHRGTDEMHGSRSKSEVQHIEHGSKKTRKKKSFQSSSQASSHHQPSKSDGRKKQCFRCGDPDHFADKCRHKSTVCNSCKKKRHLEKVCLSKAKEKKGTDDAHHLEEPCVIKDVFHLSAVQGLAGKFLLNLTINHRELTFEVDTGSPVSLINVRDKRQYFNDLDILPTTTRLVSYCDNDIGVLGKIMVNVVANGEELTLPLHVAESSRHPLLGRDWLLAMNLDFNRVFRPGTHSVSYCGGKDQSTASALNALLDKFSHIFDERVGKIEGVQASLTVRKDTKPVYVKARPVAFAVRDAVDKEIDQFIDKEAYSIIFGVRKFHQYLYGRRFTLVTDNKPISQIFSESKGLPTMSAMRMQHYAAFLQAFDYRIRHRRSSDHFNADAMSRLPTPHTDPESEIEEPDAVEVNAIQTLPLTVDELGSATLSDDSVRELVRALRTGKAVDGKFRIGVDQEQFGLQKDCLMRGSRNQVACT
nr:uncharacterized protein LOC115267334 [Aedes albopictus]